MSRLLKPEEIRPGDTWYSSAGCTVRIEKVIGEWVHYSWKENGRTEHHRKLYYAFQCRYRPDKPNTTAEYHVRFNHKQGDGYWKVGEEIVIRVPYDCTNENEKSLHSRAKEVIREMYPTAKEIVTSYC